MRIATNPPTPPANLISFETVFRGTTVIVKTRRCRWVLPVALGRSCLSSAALWRLRRRREPPPTPLHSSSLRSQERWGHRSTFRPDGRQVRSVSSALPPPSFPSLAALVAEKWGPLAAAPPRRWQGFPPASYRRNTSPGRGFAPALGRPPGRTQFARSRRIARGRLPRACCPLARASARRPAPLGRPGLLGAVTRAASHAPGRRAPPSRLKRLRCPHKFPELYEEHRRTTFDVRQ